MPTKDSLSYYMDSVTSVKIQPAFAGFSTLLNGVALRHIKRLCIRSFQLLSDLYCHVLVCDNVIQPCACFHHSILHQDTVSDLCALRDLNTSEENTVLHIAFDHAAISHKVIFCLTSVNISCRVVITDLCVDLTTGNSASRFSSSRSFIFSSK